MLVPPHSWVEHLGHLSAPTPTHQHRVFTVVRAIESRQRLPAFRREPRDVGVSDVAKHFIGNRRNAKRNARPLVVGALSACRRAEPRTGSLRFVTLAAVLTDSSA
jgi:hypothetical protein